MMLVTDGLRLATHAIGVLVAVFGACVAAREGTRRYRQEWVADLRRLPHFVVHLMPWHRHSVTVNPESAHGAIDVSSNVTVSVSGLMWYGDDAPIELKIDALRQRDEAIHADVRKLREELNDRLSALRSEITDGLSVHAAKLDALRRDHALALARAEKIDARGIPLIVFGAILSGWPDGLMPAWLAWSFLALISVVTGQWVYHRKETI
jgi:hypothetical protein